MPDLLSEVESIYSAFLASEEPLLDWDEFLRTLNVSEMDLTAEETRGLEKTIRKFIVARFF